MPMHKSVRGLLLAVFTLALLAAGSAHGAPSGNIIYVNRDATGSNNGSSWTDAFTDLQDALGVAQAGDEIWVAQSVYYPAPDAIDRTATFELQDGVGLYGGFAGTEVERSQRDWEANVTVLSGDLDRNDTTDEHGVVTDTVGIVGRNAHHVVMADGTGDTTVLDGFVVSAGLTLEYGTSGQVSGGGMYSTQSSALLTNVAFIGNEASSGGGLFNYESYIVLTNVTFTRNQAGGGGGMVNAVSSPRLTNVTFIGNEASSSGGGLYNAGGRPALANVTFAENEAANLGGGMYSRFSSPTLTDVTFGGNRAGSGGGMYNYDSVMHSSTLTNVSFIGNRAEEFGGGMSNVQGVARLHNVVFTGNLADLGGAVHNRDGDIRLMNVTIAGNRARSIGGGLYDQDGSPVLGNSILWGNAAPIDPQICDEGQYTVFVTYSDVEGDYYGLGNMAADPVFVDPVSAEEAPTGAGDYRIRAGSPVIDAGTNSLVVVETDLQGNPRIVDGNGDGNAIVDMGAYEIQPSFREVYLPLVLANH